MFRFLCSTLCSYRLVLCAAILLGLLSYFLFLTPSTKSQSSALKTIAITQIVQHPSLDKVRQGMIDELAKEGYVDGKSVQVVYKNAQGSVVLAAQIADQFIALKPAVMVGIATPSAQALVNKAQKNQAIVFASITDPIAAKLVTNLAKPDANVTGTRNVSPMDKEISLIKTILPQAKTLGIILNYGEANSVESLNKVTLAAKHQGIIIKTSAASSSADVPMAVTNLASKVDAILLLQDNTVASALPAVLEAAASKHLPVFSTYIDAVHEGALAGLAFDEYGIGEQTGKIIATILQGEKPGDIPVQDPLKIELAINEKTADQLHIQIPDALIKEAKHVYQ